jgi:hypothetical protein
VNSSLSAPLRIALTGIFIITLFIGLRWYFGGQDITAFIQAGSDFVHTDQLPAPVKVYPGQGYDGQFFYRLALDPTNFSQEDYGIVIDHPSYRIQRIVYPALAWIFSGFGQPGLVPWSLVLVNILAMGGVMFFVSRFILHLSTEPIHAFFPLLLSGVYMSVSKDLSEVTELFFFSGCIWFLLRHQHLWFSIFATLMLLTRETGLVFYIPLALYLVYRDDKGQNERIRFLAPPVLIWMLWKFYLHHSIPGSPFMEGTGNLTWPFAGLWPGLRANLDFSSTEKILQLIFWSLHLIWQVWFMVVVTRIVAVWNPKNRAAAQPLVMVFYCWLLFAICLSPAIYSDDWSFVRIFTLWNLSGFLLISTQNQRPSKWFLSFALLMAILTIIRLVIKV